MERETFAYCGLNCAACQEKFADIRQKMEDLEAALEAVNIEEMAKAIPMMHAKYKKHRQFVDFFRQECPGCRNGGGNPFCGIRKCARKKGYLSCMECETDLCGKFKTILKVHADKEIQNNREIIKKLQ